MNDLTPREKAIAAWGEPLPDWIEALALQLESTSQVQIGKAIGYSNTAVSQALNNNYTGARLAGIEEAIRGAFMGGIVHCPVLGELPNHECRKQQIHKYPGNHPVKLRLYRSCRNCSHRRNSHV